MKTAFKQRLSQKWWFRWIRGYTWFSFRYWWVNYLLWGLIIGALIGLLLTLNELNQCHEDKEINKILRRIDRQLESCCHCGVVVPEIDSLQADPVIDSLREAYDACNGEVTVTLAWQTTDDLDLHLVEPNGTVVYYNNRRSSNGAELDIDMNAGGNGTATPIENICYRSSAPTGKYQVIVHFYRRDTREPEIPYTVYVRNGSSQKYFQGVHTTPREKHLVYEFNYPE